MTPHAPRRSGDWQDLREAVIGSAIMAGLLIGLLCIVLWAAAAAHGMTVDAPQSRPLAVAPAPALLSIRA